MTISNEQLTKEINTLKADIIQLRTNIDAMEDENRHLKTENQQLKVSQLSEISDAQPLHMHYSHPIT